jgi:arsenate reductase (thioredoxin)
MAEGILQYLRPSFKVFSAGVKPEKEVSPYAVRVMEELDIDISQKSPTHSDEFLTQAFDYVITVCDHAKEHCPMFTGKVKHRKHISFPDPYHAKGTDEEVMQLYRKVRDDIMLSLEKLVMNEKI